MGNESQDNEVTFGAGLTPEGGIYAKVRSRAVSAYDYLLGARIDRKRTSIDAETARARAISDVEVEVIKTLGDLHIKELRDDPELRARAMENLIPFVVRRQEKLETLTQVALEDLRTDPPSEAESNAGPEQLSEQFLNRIEHYTVAATEAEIREKWGKVLAAETRRPGTFSPRVLRTIDEIEPETARLFAEFCTNRLDDVVPQVLVGELPFQNQADLVSAGLLVDPVFPGHARQGHLNKDGQGTELWTLGFGDKALAFENDANLKSVDGVISREASLVELNVYVLTRLGKALASIMPDHSDEAIERLASKLADVLPKCLVRQYKRAPQQDKYVIVKRHGPREANLET